MAVTTIRKPNNQAYPLLDPKERLLRLQSIKGMWKDHKPNPIKELQKIRKEWDRKLPSLR